VRLMLDSAFIIDLMNGLPEAIARQARMYEVGDDPLINEIVVCEVRAGLRGDGVGRLERLLEGLEFIQPGPETALRAGSWREAARRRGRHLSLADALIAAGAFDSGAAVLTRNVKDFVLTPVLVQTY
jgi:predicted nucleic acid-binding protein